MVGFTLSWIRSQACPAPAASSRARISISSNSRWAAPLWPGST